MTTPGGGGPGPGAPWWVMQATVVSHGQQQYTAVQSATRPKDTAVSTVAAGPFPTKAAADAWIAAQQSVSFPSLPNPLSFLATIGNIGHWAGIFVAAVTDVHTYISVGWLFLGFVLLVAGILLWWAKAADVNVSNVSSTAALVA